MINRKLVMAVLSVLSTTRRLSSTAAPERVATKWAFKLNRLHVNF